jgi:hypothetical protein
MDCNFSLKHYNETLALAKEKGYTFSRMRDYDKNIDNSKVIFLRHDVDIQIENALNMAIIEAKLGISATYFFRIHAQYNLLSLKNYEIMQKILELGHEIGLHHEVDFAKLVNKDEKNMLRMVKKVFELITEQKVKGLTHHEPCRSSKLVNDDNLKEFDFEYEGYSPKFIKNLKYISDSSCRWREGCMCEFIKKGVPKLYILIHPIWWFDKSPIQNY